MLKNIVEAAEKKKRSGKEKLYVHVVINHGWLLGFLYGTGKTMANFKRPLRDIFMRRVKAVGSPCSIKLVIGTWDHDPGKVFVSACGEFSAPPPKGAKAKDVMRVAREAVAYMLDRQP